MTTPYASEAFLHQLLGKALSAGASDVHLKVGQPPGARVRGDLVFFRVDKVRPDDTEAAVRILLGAPVGIEDPEDLVPHERLFSYEAQGIGRFRVSAFRQKGALSLVMRSIPLAVPTPADLGLPAVATALAEAERGLVILTGVAGSGRSTTAAALVGHLNDNYPRHVVTLEDPIEHLHEDRRGIIAQRAVGLDVTSVAAGLRAALVQDADVIYAAALPSPEALEAALDAAELGHLVLAVVPAPDAVRAVARLLALGRALPAVSARLAAALQGVIAQRLLAKRDGSGEVLAAEVLLASAPVRDAIRCGGDDLASALREQMEKASGAPGAQTFEMHVKQLASQGLVSRSQLGS